MVTVYQPNAKMGDKTIWLKEIETIPLIITGTIILKSDTIIIIK